MCCCLVCWCLARQHKSQFDELIEAARKNRTGLKKPGVQSATSVTDQERKLDDGLSSTSSLELITDNDMMLPDDMHADMMLPDDLQTVINQPLNGNLP